MNVTALARTLDQELIALARGVSLECLVCGEFVLHVHGAHGLAIACPECRSLLVEGHGVVEELEIPGIELPSSSRPGDRGRCRKAALEESPDTAGQDAGEIPDGESRWKVAQKGDRRRTSAGKGEKVG